MVYYCNPHIIAVWRISSPNVYTLNNYIVCFFLIAQVANILRKLQRRCDDLTPNGGGVGEPSH